MLRWLLYPLIAYLLLLGFLWVMQERMLYMPNTPSRALEASPADRGWDYEDVTLETEDGVRVHGWWLPVDSPRGSLIFFHGNAGNISHRLASLSIFRDLGLSVLIIDYRGYGESEGSPSEAGFYRDAQAAWDHLRQERGVPASEIILFGRSLGAAVASGLAASLPAEDSAGAVILESPFRSVPEMAQALYPFLPARWLTRMDYDNEKHVQSIEAPLLIIHSEDDEIVPYAQGRAVYEAASSPKTFLGLSGGHNTGFFENQDR